MLRYPYREKLFGRRSKAAPAAQPDELPVAGDSAGPHLDAPHAPLEASQEVTRS
jgi:hypothetical protein